MAMVDKVREYILTCPYIDDLKKVNVNFLSEEPNNCSIEEMPSPDNNVIRTYVDGSKTCKFDFVLACMFHYSEELGVNIDNSNFFENFSGWVERNDNEEIYPQLDDGLVPSSIRVTSNGYLFMVPQTMDRARYQIQLRLEYEKEA